MAATMEGGNNHERFYRPKPGDAASYGRTWPRPRPSAIGMARGGGELAGMRRPPCPPVWGRGDLPDDPNVDERLGYPG